MMERIIILTIVLIGFISISSCQDDYLKENPHYFDSCKISEPEFTKCSTKSVTQLFQQVNKGLPNIKEFPKLEPFTLKKIRIDQGNNNAVNVKVELSNVLVYGIANLIVKESKVSPKDYSWRTKFLFPSMRIEGDYALEGRILLISLNGKGRISLILDNMDVILYTKTRLYEKGGFTFCNVTSTKADYTISGLKANLTNLFNGNTELEESTNAFFNENWQTLSDALKPVIQQTVSDILLDIMKRIFNFIPANYFVSDIPKSTELYG